MSWKVHRHGPVRKLEDNLWEVVGSHPSGYLPRRMTVVRRRDGDLVIHSAVALEEGAMKELEALGKPRYLLVPGGFHRADLPRYVERYPSIEVFCPRGALPRVRELAKVSGTYEEFPVDEDMLFVPALAGTGEREGAVIVRSGNRLTLLFCDALFNLPHGRGLGGFVLRFVTDSTGEPKVSRLFRLVTVADRPAFMAHLQELAGTPGLSRILPAHGDPIEGDAAGTLRRIGEAG